MDELDRLLLNVETNAELNEIKETEKESKAKSVRKSDKNLGEEEYDDISNNSYESIYEDLKITPAVQSFRESYLEGIKPHWNYVIDFKNLISDMTLPEPVIVGLRKYKYTFLRSIENIESLYESYLTTKSIEDFEKNSRQEVKLFFPGQETNQQHINFLNLKEIYLRIREFNSKVRKNWKELGVSLNGMSLVNESAKFMENAKEVVEGGMKVCSNTDVFIEFLASILYIPKKDLDVIEKDIGNRIYFRDDFDYDYRGLFKYEQIKKGKEAEASKNERYHPVEDEFAGNEDVHSTLEKSEDFQQQNSSVSAVDKTAEKTGFLEELMKVPGKSSWNTKEPYVIKIDRQHLEKNEEDLEKSILFLNREMTKEEVDASIKRSMIRSIGSRAKSITSEYEEFLYKQLNVQCNTIQETFAHNEYDMDLFLYHCGPQTVFMTLKRIFSTGSIGLCYKRLSDNRITRFIPEEYIKTVVMRYFTDNVFIHDLQFNSIQEFNRIRQYVHGLYKESIEQNRKKIKIAVDHYLAKTGKRISPESLFMKRIPIFYKPHEIEVYRRFVDRTVFR